MKKETSELFTLIAVYFLGLVFGALLGVSVPNRSVEIAPATTNTPTITATAKPTAKATKKPIKRKVEKIKEKTKVVSRGNVNRKKSNVKISDSDIDLLALVTMAEAEGESEMGKRLVIDTILNRVDSNRCPNTVKGVVYQPYQFTSMTNGRVDRCYVRKDIRKLVIEELESRTNYDVIYFRTGRYSDYGTPLFKVGNHYFSSY